MRVAVLGILVAGLTAGAAQAAPAESGGWADRPATPREAGRTPDSADILSQRNARPMRLTYVTRSRWTNEGWVRIFVDLDNRVRTGDQVSYFAAYVFETPLHIEDAPAPAAARVSQLTVRCSTLSYRFDATIVLGEQLETLRETRDDPVWRPVNRDNAGDVMELETVCEAPEGADGGRVFTSIDAAIAFARGRR